MANPFEEFGGTELPPMQKEEQDPFAEFGGAALKTKDPFAEFGGKSIEPEEGGWFQSKDITQAEIQDIAARNKADPALLTMFAPYLGASVEGEEGLITTGRRAVGFVSEALGGLPTWMAKKAQDENTQRAIDELNALTEKKKSTLQAGAEIAAGILTPTAMVAKAGRAGIATAGALEGAGMALGESKTGEELSSAALGGAIGGAAGFVLGPLIIRAGAGGKSVVEGESVMEGIEALKKEANEAERGILDAVEEETAKKLPLWKADAESIRNLREVKEVSPELQQKVMDFAKKMGGETNVKSFDDAVKVVNDAKAQLSPADFEKTYEQFRQQTDDSILKQLAELTREEPGIVTSIRSAKNAFVDFMSVGRDIDRRRGTDVYSDLLNATKKTNAYQVQLRSSLVKKQPLSIEYSRLTDASMAELRDALTGAGKYEGLTEEAIQKAVPTELKSQYEGWRKWFDEELNTAKELGVPIQRRQNYLPDQMMDMPEAIVAIERMIAKAAKETNVNPLKMGDNLDLKELLKSDSMQQLARAATYLTGETINSPSKLAEVLRKSIEPGSDVFVSEIKASALLKRTGLMPDFLKEKDVGKLANRWAQQTYRYAFLKDSLASIQQQAFYLRKAGAVNDAEKLQRLHDEFLGQARFVASATRKAAVWLQTRALRQAEKAEDGVVKGFYQAIAEAPDVFQNLVLNVYPNFLGANPVAVVQNLTGGLYMMIPELGSIYGAKAVLPAYMRAIKNSFSSKYWQNLEKLGYVAPQWTTELKEAIRSGKAPGLFGRVTDRTANAMMLAFEWSEKINRAVAYETGKILAKDAVNKAPSALKYVDTMPERLKRKMLQAVQDQDEVAAEDIISRYFADRTLFSYNRITSSEFARAVGPLFSMFTKYPSAITGRVIDIYGEKGAKGGTIELARWAIGPLMAGTAINTLIEPGSGTEEFLFGKPREEDAPIWARGATLSSPFFSVKSILEGRMFTPPLVGATKELGLGGFELLEGDPERLGRAIKNAARAFTPGGAQAIVNLTERLTGKDVPILGKEE